MTIDEILTALAFFGKEIPVAAIDEAGAHREEITPALLHILEVATRHIEKTCENEEYSAHIYAMYLLAQFHEPRAYPLLVEFFSLPGDVIDRAVGDITSEVLPRMLASVCHGDLSLIKGLIENERIDEYVRSAALRALLVLVVEGALPREEVVEYYRTLFRERMPRENYLLWSSLVAISADLYPEELLEDIEQAYRDNLVDLMFIDREDVQRYLAAGKEATLQQLAEDPHNHYIGDTKDEMYDWYSYGSLFPDEWIPAPLPEAPALPATSVPRPVTPRPSSTQTRSTPKVGRNQPCTCGSGKKYKQCCGR